ncbi:MAG TPA: GAF domain-containing protein [Actinomycetota bacterium]|jgi:signal transduction protein with GAF and PtsI domain|nr:GAF domain-containing protein [Actinomycetota bacterium]
MADDARPFDELAQAAADLGPAIEPPGYQDLLEWIVNTAREVTGAEAASIAVLDQREEILRFVAASGTAGDQVVGIEMDAGKGIAGWALASGQSITISDAPSDPRFAADVAAKTGYTPRSVFAIPLESDAGTMGVMEILDAEEGRDHAENESRVVTTLAYQAAVAIETMTMFRDLGRVLFRAAAKAAADDAVDVKQALEQTAERARGSRKELAEMLEIFYEIGRLGAEERAAATDLLDTFLRYSQGNRG